MREYIDALAIGLDNVKKELGVMGGYSAVAVLVSTLALTPFTAPSIIAFLGISTILSSLTIGIMERNEACYIRAIAAFAATALAVSVLATTTLSAPVVAIWIGSALLLDGLIGCAYNLLIMGSAENASPQYRASSYAHQMLATLAGGSVAAGLFALSAPVAVPFVCGAALGGFIYYGFEEYRVMQTMDFMSDISSWLEEKKNQILNPSSDIQL